ncbi:MAG: DUF6261 family protein [Tannerellaceae bacterium]|jgi:hypothetical protein|nr:DUF6261 family protein [Tannerellaceae bacterium]
MGKIEKYTRLLKSLRNGEHFEIFEEIDEFVEKHKNALGDTVELWNVLSNTFKKEDEIYKRSRKAAETRFITEAHEKRIDAFRVVKGGVETASYKDTPAEKLAAERLAFVLDNFRKIPKAPLTEASALIFNMIQDLRRTAYAPSVETLGLTGAVNTLEERNEAFKALYEEREMDIKQAEMLGNMRYIRPLTDKAFANFAEALNACYAIAKLGGKTADADALSLIITRINAAIKQYETIYARRGGATAGKNKPGGDEGDDEDNGGLPDTPGSNAPSLAVASQEVLSDTVMYIYPAAADADAFAQALYPAAAGGVLLLEQAGEAPVLFPVTGFKTESEGGADTVKALDVASPSANHSFISPFTGEGPCQAWVEKDGEELARFTGMAYPLMLALDAGR